MEKFYMVCDESGAKGYSNNQEQCEGEIGVMAGFIIPSKRLRKVQSETNTIRDQYLTDGKLHITDISSEQQEQLRNEVFAFIINNNITCIYEAIHTEGFHEYSSSIIKMAKTVSENKRSNIKTSHHEYRESLHSQLFLGVFAKAISFCLDSAEKDFCLKIITDQVDDCTMGKFKRQASEFLSYGTASNTQKVTGFNPDTKQVVSGKIVITAIDSNNIIDDISGIKFDIQTEDSGLTLLADVIANSINYHFKNRDKKDIGKPLNTKLAIKCHPLENLTYGLWECNETNYSADALYMHPKDNND